MEMIMRTTGCILLGIIALVYFIGRLFNKDICEDIADDKVSRHYGGEK
jgi:hypothetical protein